MLEFQLLKAYTSLRVCSAPWFPKSKKPDFPHCYKRLPDPFRTCSPADVCVSRHRAQEATRRQHHSRLSLLCIVPWWGSPNTETEGSRPSTGGRKPADAQLMVSQAHGQKGKGSKLTQGRWFFCRSQNLRQTSPVSEQAAMWDRKGCWLPSCPLTLSLCLSPRGQILRHLIYDFRKKPLPPQLPAHPVLWLCCVKMSPTLSI